MHEDIKFNFARDVWCSDDGEVEIGAQQLVRLRLLGVTVEAGAIVSRSFN